jgi:hypothetical protein
MQDNTKLIKNLHLVISSFVIIIMGLLYGINPHKIVPLLFDFNVESVDLNNIFRAIMGLYIGMAIYWIIGIIKPSQWRNATLVNIIFMGGLAFGRIISFVIDGISIPYSKGLAIELFFMIWGMYNLSKK